MEVEKIYQKKELRDHILDRPDSYVGSIEVSTDVFFVKGVQKQITYVPALLKIFDEILVNAIDHAVRTKQVSSIKVETLKDGSIEVFNDGPGIPVVLHKEYNIYIPQMIFGMLLTSSNYNDTEQRIVGGRNGLGSKLTALFSKKFVIETVNNGLLYTQEITENMSVIHAPVIKKTTKKDYTKITYLPDFKKFKISSNKTQSFIGTMELIESRVYDTTCTTENVNLFYNQVKLPIKGFKKFLGMFDKEFITETIKGQSFDWDVAVGVHNSEAFQQVSFVNGINTYKGGKHVDYIVNQITKALVAKFEAKKKVDVKASYIKDRLMVVLKTNIVNPSFSNQSKDTLTTNYSNFGIKIDIPDAFIDKIYKNTSIVSEVMSFVNYKQNKELQKTGGNETRKSKISVKNLEDAIFAGTAKSNKCTLILTEGLSAKTFAVSGLSVVGREYYGVFPLKGKLLNVREATQSQLLKNEETNNIKKIIGLQHGKKYKTTDGLRYGSVMILTDADDDGLHISALIMNMFHTWWPELLENEGFIVSMKTPIIKVSLNTKTIEFYSISDYNKWKENESNYKKYNIKYYKGLGTSTAKEAKDIFKGISQNVVKYISNDKNITNQALLLAFEKKKADDRKIWLSNYNIDNIIEFTSEKINYDDFINKGLIHFSMSDIIRSIPSMVDGLKPSQRKVLYTMFKKNYKKEIKVAQLGASVAEATEYKHGEASLFSTIINLAQDYVGSNNINLLKPNGQFGCLDPETEILLWDGSIKKAKYIEEGNLLVGDDGLQRVVLRTTCGHDEMYKVSLENGDSYTVNSKHILTFYIPLHKTIKEDKSKKMSVMTIWDNEEYKFLKIPIIYDTQSQEEKTIILKLLEKRSPMHKCFDIPLEDYLTFPSSVKEMLFGYKLKKSIMWPDNNSLNIINPYYVFEFISRGFLRHIPRKFIINNALIRFRILKGFFDFHRDCLETTSKYISINKCYTNVGDYIFKQLTFICESLGMSVKNNQGYFTLYTDNIYNYNFLESPVDNNAKVLGFDKLSIDVKSVGRGPFVGWEVNGNERFLLGNFVVTHNSRISNGKDAASPRYIYTELNDITLNLFNPLDEPVLNYLEDDGVMIEPEYFVPVLPLILINGALGIGTAYSTFIPNYNPVDIINNINRYISGKEMLELSPWYKGFKGKIVDNIIYGVFDKTTDTTIVIKELPLISIDDYTEYLDKLIEETPSIGIKNFVNKSNDKDINIVVSFDNKKSLETLMKGDIIKILKLYKHISTTNMHLFDADGKIKKYSNPNEIIKDFVKVRLSYNLKRKTFMIKEYSHTSTVLSNKIRFLYDIINDTIIIYKKPKKEIIQLLKEHKYNIIDDDTSYGYLLNMNISSFTEETIKSLENNLEKIKQQLIIINSKTEKDILIQDLQKIKENK